jgi:hypothetical protein
MVPVFMPSFATIYAEVEIVTHHDLPSDLSRALASRFSPPTAVAEALAETIFRKDTWLAGSVVYARLTHDLVFVVFSEDRRSLKVHLQRRAEASSLAEVRRSAEEIADRFEEFVRYHRLKKRNTAIKITAASSRLQTGGKLSARQRVFRSLRSDVISTLSIPVATVLVSVPLGFEVEKALVNGLVALVALVLRSLLGAALQKAGFEYE